MGSGIMYVPRLHGAPRRSGASSGQIMGWALVSSMFWPRLFILGFWIFGSRLSRAFDSWLIPAAGFVVAPWTTISYALMWGVSSHGVHGWEWAVVAVGIILDLATWMGLGRLMSRR